MCPGRTTFEPAGVARKPWPAIAADDAAWSSCMQPPSRKRFTPRAIDWSNVSHWPKARIGKKGSPSIFNAPPSMAERACSGNAPVRTVVSPLPRRPSDPITVTTTRYVVDGRRPLRWAVWSFENGRLAVHAVIAPLIP